MDPLSSLSTPEVIGILPDEAPMEIEVEDVVAHFGEESDADESEPPEPDYSQLPHEANLAGYMDESELTALGVSLGDQFQNDLDSRADWEKTAKDGLELLGLQINPPKDEPFKGASAVIDPIVTEAIVRFQSNAIQEIFPGEGPVQVKIWGKLTDEKKERAQRKKDHMNHTLVTVMDDYREETEKLLWDLAYCGSAFRKVYNDPETQDPVAQYLPAEKVVIPYGYGSLWKAPRYACLIDLDAEELKRLMMSGFYRRCDLGPAMEIQPGVFQDAKDKLTKQTPIKRFEGHQVVEMYCKLFLPQFEPKVLDEDSLRVESPKDGIASPYVVTFEKQTNKILSIYRNWKEDDTRRKPLHWIVQYTYIPGPGSYGLGLIHLIGNLAKADTGILRNLMDSGALNNLKGWFGQGLRQKDGPVRMKLGEVVNLEVQAQRLADVLMPIDFREPSQVLAAVRQEIKADARSLASIADTDIQANGEVPVGTMLAMLERSLKVMSAIHGRLHRSLKKEFLILERVVRRQLHDLVEGDPEREYPYDVVGGERKVKLADYADTLTSEPVSDPSMATFAQRVMQYQAVLNLSQQAPQAYDLPKLHRSFAQFIGIREADDIIPDKSHIPARDPATENAMLMMGSPVKAYPWQDHQSHLATVMSFIQDPMRKQDVGQMPQGQQIMAAAMAHALEHIAHNEYHKIEAQLGFPLPPLGEPIPPEIEIPLSGAIARAAQQVFQQDVAQAQQQQAQQQAQDPVLQLQQKQVEIDQFKAQSDASAKMAKIQSDAQAKQAREETERQRIAAQQKTAMAKLQAELLWIQKELDQGDEEQGIKAAQINEIKARTAKLMAEIEQMSRPEQADDAKPDQ